jgi:Domain of unknown function (DUF5615)
LLLDEMFPQAMAEQLNAKGHDVRSVVANPAFVGLPDEDILIGATEAGRALVTVNIKDLMPIDARYRAAPRSRGADHGEFEDLPAEQGLCHRDHHRSSTPCSVPMAAFRPAESFSSLAPRKPDGPDVAGTVPGAWTTGSAPTTWSWTSTPGS